MSNKLSLRRMKIFTNKNYLDIPEISLLDSDTIKSIKILGNLFPFRVNDYVTENLIDWTKAPDDPIYRLVFPHRDMLNDDDYMALEHYIDSNDLEGLKSKVRNLRSKMNPHPGGQMDENVPEINGIKFRGIQHKYNETVLFFPKEGQTCHSYCSYCFRWPQFINEKDYRFSANSKDELPSYLRHHKEVTDVLFTGGDPMILSTKKLSQYMEILLEPEFSHIQNIRIGTKSLTYWPYRFLNDHDSEDLFDLFEKIIANGKNIFLMAHFGHWKEIEQEPALEAIYKLKKIGASIYSQAPMLSHINDDPSVWKRLWKAELNNGIVPYYVFMARNTGANKYFRVPIYKALNIFNEVITDVSGLTKTVRGPVMSTKYGKAEIQGVTEINNQKYFSLRFIQARDVNWINKPFFAEYCEKAAWIDELKPAFGEEKFFFQK
jgi:KamA family protein